jgi:recombinational DNA repair protein (RecF pathway)
MTEETTIGLLLQAIPYLSNKKILKVLTPEGIMSFISGKKNLTSLTTPFIWAEWVFTRSKKEIFPLNDGTMLDDLASLKENYGRLSAAGQIANDLLKTQMPGKDASEPITLALACLRKLSLFSETKVLVAAFRLKLLHLEGLIDADETPEFETLLLSRSFTQLASLPKDEKLLEKIDRFFEERVDY